MSVVEGSPSDVEDGSPEEQGLEETADELDREEPDPDPVKFWEERQRELVVSVLNYNLATLSDLIHSQKIDLSPRYQRRARWDARRQSALVESFLMNVPVPSVFLNEDDYGKYSVIDGKQRLTAIHNFLRGRLTLDGLKVFAELNGSTIDDVPGPLRSALETRAALQAIIILRQSDKDVKFEVFKRLNTGGVRLNPQEIRNSTWAGPFNDLVLELSESGPFHALLGITRKDRSSIWREMRDAEFVLRYFAFRHTWSDFSGGMQRQMDTFMANQQYADDAALADMRNAFDNTVACVGAAFGEHAFKRWLPIPGQWRQQVLAALYDAQMFACSDGDPVVLRDHRDALIVGMKELFTDTEFRNSIDAATNTPSLFRHRVGAVKELIDNTLAG